LETNFGLKFANAKMVSVGYPAVIKKLTRQFDGQSNSVPISLHAAYSGR